MSEKRRRGRKEEKEERRWCGGEFSRNDFTRDGNNFHRAREGGEIEKERERSRERGKAIAGERREMRTRKKLREREEKKERGEVPLSVARRREAPLFLPLARGREARERGNNSPLRAQACAGERRRVGERGRKFSPLHARMHARTRRQERGEGEQNRERER